jgi:virginiamycin B lyase
MDTVVTIVRNVCLLLLAAFANAALADVIPGTGSLSGLVTAESPFQAAKVYARNADRHMTYMVYTAKGRFRAINVVPGSYSVTVEKPGFATESREVVVKAGAEAAVDFKLRKDQGNAQNGDLTATYDEIYPPGAGRDVLESTCSMCHGKRYIAQRAGLDADGWDALITVMTAQVVPGTKIPTLPPGLLTPEKRRVLVEYLSRNLGPGKPVRELRTEDSTMLEESALASAMWIQYSVANPKTAAGTWRKFQEPYFDMKGNVWITEPSPNAPAIVRLDPRTQTWTSFPLSNVDWYPHGITVDPVDGSVWWAGRGVDVVRLDPASGKSKAYGDLSDTQRWGGHTPVFDSKGDLWYTLLYQSAFGKWSRSTDSVSHYEIPNKGGKPYGVLVDQQDRVVAAELAGCRLTRLDPKSGTFAEFVSPSAPCYNRRPGLDSKGRLWYGVFNAGKLGVIEPDTAKIIEYPIDRFAEPYEASADPQDKIWMSDGGRGGVLVRFDPETKKFTNYPGLETTDMPKMAITREGAVWYANRGAAARGRAPAAVGVLYPDMNLMTSFGAYYAVKDGRAVGNGSPIHAARPARASAQQSSAR